MDEGPADLGQSQQRDSFRSAWHVQLVGLTTFFICFGVSALLPEARSLAMQVFQSILWIFALGCMVYGVATSIVGLFVGLDSQNGIALLNSGIGCAFGIVSGAIAIPLVSVFVLVGLGLDSLHSQPETKLVQQRLPDPDRGIDYLLLTNARAFEPTWYVYTVDSGEDPTPSMLVQGDSTGSVIHNYSEGARFTSNPTLEIFDSRFLIFWRGGFPHSIFDLQESKLLFDEDRYDWDASLAPEEIALDVNGPPASEEDAQVRSILIQLLRRERESATGSP
jgi:hypothetical protein